MIFHSLEEMVGKTPLLRLHRLEKILGSDAKIFAKLESANPAGSAKDRAALSMILAAEASGKLKAGGKIVEPTSGNTGIALAAIGAARGYEVVIYMPENMSKERKLLMQAYGAKVILTPAAEGMKGAIQRAEEAVAAEENAILAGQFENPANPKAHRETTGPEIFLDLDGEVDGFVAGMGTGGSITGVASFLKEKKADVRIFGVEPASAPFLSGGKGGPHGLQGIGANFLPGNLDLSLVDEILTVSEEEAYAAARLLSKTEGILVGISSGAALSATIRLAKEEGFAGKNLVVLLPDGGERYLSTPLYGEEA